MKISFPMNFGSNRGKTHGCEPYDVLFSSAFCTVVVRVLRFAYEGSSVCVISYRSMTTVVLRHGCYSYCGTDSFILRHGFDDFSETLSEHL